MYGLIVFVHVLACVALILIVLLQTGRGAEIGATFGGASQTLFGSTGRTTFLNKLTTGAAIVFMLTCLSLTYLSGRPDTHSIMENVQVNEPAPQPQPALPEAKPVAPPAQPQTPGAAPGAPQSPAPSGQ